MCCVLVGCCQWENKTGFWPDDMTMYTGCMVGMDRGIKCLMGILLVDYFINRMVVVEAKRKNVCIFNDVEEVGA